MRHLLAEFLDAACRNVQRAAQGPSTGPGGTHSDEMRPEMFCHVILAGVSDITEQTVPPLPLLWWGVRATLPCKPHPNEEPRRETEKAATRALSVRP